MMSHEKLGHNLFVLSGAVNTGVLLEDDRALLIDCCDSVTPERLHALGVAKVDRILCTQHRCPNVVGAYPFIDDGAALVVPEKERDLFEKADDYWNDWHNRWHLYHARPSSQVLPRSITVTDTVRDGDRIAWGGFEICVIETPGMTDGSVSYLVTGHGNRVCFVGDGLCGPGRVWELYSLQQGFGGSTDYHGFLGAWPALCASARKIAELPIDLLVPSHGTPFTDPPNAAAQLEERLKALWSNYCAISALHFHFPSMIENMKDDPARMPRAVQLERPDWVPRVTFTSFAVVSKTGAAFLIDCGHDSVVSTLEDWLREGRITSVEGCWVTHYHDDHVDSLHRFAHAFRKPIYTIREMAEVIAHPLRYFLPCISPCGMPEAKAFTDGDSWDWNEFRFTAYHFPGQTYYHSALLVEGNGQRIFFSGDSGTPTGLDDYTAGNRVFLGKARGSRRCLDIWRQVKPDQIISQHQNLPFIYTSEQLDQMDRVLQEREALITDVTPWPDANFAIDEWWMRTYPYEQETRPGTSVAIEVRFTNHVSTPAEVCVEPVLPDGWSRDANLTPSTVTLPAQTEGEVYSWLKRPDIAEPFWVDIPKTVQPGTYCIPFRITWNGQYMGPCRHALIVVF